MTLVKELREKAALCRRAARVPTNGGRAVDRILIELAEQLEHQAEAVNRPQMRQESVIFNSRNRGIMAKAFSRHPKPQRRRACAGTTGNSARLGSVGSNWLSCYVRPKPDRGQACPQIASAHSLAGLPAVRSAAFGSSPKD
jgi:hypothetical protein